MLGILVEKGIDVYFILKKYFFEGSILKSKKIKDVRKQYHSNKNYTYCNLMTDLGLS